jgi:hypothetical protein
LLHSFLEKQYSPVLRFSLGNFPKAALPSRRQEIPLSFPFKDCWAVIMFGVQSVLFITLVLDAVLAAPAPHLRKKRSFKIPRVQQHNYVPDGTFALRKAYRKFGLGTLDTYPGINFSPKVAAAIDGKGSTEDGEVSASPTQNDAQFLSPVTVGGQTLVLNFDSGSSDM